MGHLEQPGEIGLIIKQPKSKKWRCTRGHEYEAPEVFKVTARDGQLVLLREAIVCPICYVEWVGQNVPGVEEVKEK